MAEQSTSPSLVDYLAECLTDDAELPLDADVLYSSPCLCQVLFRMMTPLCQQYVLRLLFVGENGINAKLLLQGCCPGREHERLHEMAVVQLIALKVVTYVDDDSSANLLLPNLVFMDSLRSGLASMRGAPKSLPFEIVRGPLTSTTLELLKKQETANEQSEAGEKEAASDAVQPEGPAQENSDSRDKPEPEERTAKPGDTSEADDKEVDMKDIDTLFEGEEDFVLPTRRLSGELRGAGKSPSNASLVASTSKPKSKKKRTKKYRSMTKKPESDVTVEDVNEYSQWCWDRLLMFLVKPELLGAERRHLLSIGPGPEGLVTTVQALSRGARRLLICADLLAPYDRSAMKSLVKAEGMDANEELDDWFRFNKLHMTSKGFRFLLTGLNDQLWSIMRAYVERMREMQSERVLHFLCELALLEPGTCYKLCAPDDDAELLEVRRYILADLQEFGLIYQTSLDTLHFFITVGSSRLFTTSEFTGSHVQHGTGGPDYIVAETNHRIYSYTKSQLKREILRHFIEELYELPDLWIGLITRRSVRRALALGITARDMISYLTHHAHPQMRSRAENQKWKAQSAGGVLPIALRDQIFLWEQERNRLHSQAGCVLMENFSSVSAFEKVLQWAQEEGDALWHDAEKLRIVIPRDRMEDARQVLRSTYVDVE